jgi:hypothetical protein
MTDKVSSVVLGLLVSGLAAAGCGGGSGGGSCGLGACGGDVVGSWTISDVCVMDGALDVPVPANLMAACPQASISPVEIEPSGSFVANADMTYTFIFNLTASSVMTVPMSCLGGLSCAQLNAAIALDMAMNPNPDVQSVTCVGSTTCSCTIVPTPFAQNESGNYTTSGNALITTPAGGIAESVDYCVKGDTLVVRPNMTGTGTMAETVEAIVAQK